MALSPGQIAAFYDLEGQELWGGGYLTAHQVQPEFDPAEAKLPRFDEACQVFRS